MNTQNTGETTQKPSREIKISNGVDKKLIFFLSLGALITGIVLFFTFSPSGTSLLWSASGGGTWLLPLVTVAALLDSINHCAFSILILTIAFLFSIGRLRKNVLLVGSTYIAGLFVVYILIGLGILRALHLFGIPGFMGKVGAALLILLGLINIINEFFPRFPIKLKIPDAAHHQMAILMEKGSLPTAFLLGVFVGLCEFPCTGGPYLMVLGLLHDSATFTAGLGYLLYYNLLFVSPLVVILLIASHKTLLGKVEQWQNEEKRAMRLWGGIAMVALGAVIFLL